MTLIILTRLYLYRQDIAMVFHYKIQLSQALAVIIIKVETMSLQLLRHNILIDSTIIDCLIIPQQFQLDAIGKLTRQQAHIALEEFKKISGFG